MNLGSVVLLGGVTTARGEVGFGLRNFSHLLVESSRLGYSLAAHWTARELLNHLGGVAFEYCVHLSPRAGLAERGAAIPRGESYAVHHVGLALAGDCGEGKRPCYRLWSFAINDYDNARWPVSFLLPLSGVRGLRPSDPRKVAKFLVAVVKFYIYGKQWSWIR